jgi:hypothetical protein
MEYWAEFPLRTAADVQAWHRDRTQSFESLPVHVHQLEDIDIDQDITIVDSGQLSDYNNNSNANNYANDDNFHGEAHHPEPSWLPAGPETVSHRDKTAQTVQDVWGSFLHTSDGQYPPSGSRDTASSRDIMVSPLPVGSADIASRGIESQDIPAGRGASIRHAGLGLTQEFREKFLW